MDLAATQVCYDYEDEPTQKVVPNIDKENEQVGVLIINSKSYPIYKGISKIGRHPECEILLDDQSVSKYHAEIEASTHPSSAWICDLKSSNRTILNNVVLRPSRFYELKEDSTIEFGRIKSIYKSHRVEKDFVVPETPGQTKQKNASIIILGTPDSSLNNSSIFGEDISTVAATQSCLRKSVSSCPPTDMPLQKVLQNSDKKSVIKMSLESNSEDKRVGENKITKDINESISELSEQNEQNQILESPPGISRFSMETTQNDSTEDQNDPSTSCESDDIFEAATQRVNTYSDLKSRRESCSSDETNIDENEIIINNVVPSQKERTLESSTPIKERNLEDQLEKLQNIKNDIALATKCLNMSKDLLESVGNNTKESEKENENNIDDIDMLETQVVHLPNLINTTKEAKTREEQIDIDNIDELDTQIVHLPDSDDNVNNVKKNEKRHDVIDIDLLDTQIVSTTDTIGNTTASYSTKEVQPNILNDGSIEDIDYEMAATQIIEDAETVSSRQGSEAKNSEDKKQNKISHNDSVEQKLNDMFEDASDDHVADTSMISTQCLKNVLEFSQRSDQVKDTASHLVRDAAQGQDAESAESNSQKLQTDSQNTEKYFSSLISKKKHNVLTDFQESIDLNITVRARHNKNQESNIAIFETDNNDVTLSRTSTKKSIKEKLKVAHSGNTVDHIEKDLLNSFEVSVHSSKTDAESAETPKSLDTRDDDILTLLPEVKIFGTPSNPATISSTSTAQKKTSVRRSSSRRTVKMSMANKSISGSTESLDYEYLKKKADELIAARNKETRSTRRRTTNAKEKLSIDSDVSTQCNTTNLNNKPLANTRGRKRKASNTMESRSMLNYVTRKSQKISTESTEEMDSSTKSSNTQTKQIRKQHTNIKVSKESSSNIKDSKSDNACDSEAEEESQEVEMILSKPLIILPRQRKNINASQDDESLSTTINIPYKIPAVRIKRTKLNKSNASQLSIDSDSTEDSLIGDGENTTTRVTKSRSTRSRQINKYEEKNKNTSISSKISTKNITLTDKENAKEIVSILLTPTTRSVSRSSSSLNSSFARNNKVLFTGITDDEYIKVLKTLGGTKVEDPSKCTILVTDKIRRTTKFLSALARAVPIVSISWLLESKKSGHFLDWENYMLKDPAMEAKYGFRLRKSLDKAREQKLLEGYTVLLTPNIESPPISELRTMITACGGKALLRPPPKLSEKTVIISHQDDLENARKLLLKTPKNVTVQSTEFLLTGILRQELDLVRHKLID